MDVASDAGPLAFQRALLKLSVQSANFLLRPSSLGHVQAHSRHSNSFARFIVKCFAAGRDVMNCAVRPQDTKIPG